MISPDHPFARAARANDDEADGGRLPTEIAGDLGIDGEALRYFAEQRALRVVLLKSGRLAQFQLSAGDPMPVRLSAEEQTEVILLTGLYLDGVTIGWRACQIDQK